MILRDFCDSIAIEDGILAAHAAGDGLALARCYEAAADMMERRGDVEAACFFLTQGYIFALEAGDMRAAGLRDRLAARGREHPTA